MICDTTVYSLVSECRLVLIIFVLMCDFFHQCTLYYIELHYSSSILKHLLDEAEVVGADHYIYKLIVNL